MLDKIFGAGGQTGLADRLEFAIILVGRDSGQVRFVNRRVCQDLGLPRAAILGRHYREVFWPDFVHVYEELAGQCEDGKEHTTSYYWAAKTTWEQLSAHATHLQDGSTAILLSITNISDLVADKEKYQRLALFDATLRLPNGKMLEADIAALPDTREVTLIYYDIEFFNDFNELYGWDVGDELLASIRDWMLESETDKAQLYRVGTGFALLGRHVTLEMTIQRARQIIARFRKPWQFQLAGNTLTKYLTIRLGIVFGEHVKDDMRSMLMRTLHAPRNAEGYVVYDERADAVVYEELALRDTLVNCVMKGMAGFEVYYQPIVEATTERWAGLEALCRWTTPHGTRVPPSVFIPMAEKLGLIHRIDTWVSRTAVEYCIELGLHEKGFFLDVNFSPLQKVTDEVVDALEKLLEETGFPPEKLVVEITENAKVDYDDESLRKFDRIREQGVILSLDDFGTGYSSLENLIKLSALTIKIDKTFVDDIDTDEYRQYLLHILVDIAKHLDMKVILEGVETEGQRQLLKSYDIDYYQGYLFSKPLPADVLRDSL